MLLSEMKVCYHEELHVNIKIGFKKKKSSEAYLGPCLKYEGVFLEKVNISYPLTTFAKKLRHSCLT